MQKLALSAILLNTLLYSQPPPQPLVSPVVHPDRTVSFNLRSANAQKVEARLENGTRINLVKDEKGIWSGTT